MALKFSPLKQPININLKEFILESKFDFLKLGVTKSWLQHNFVEPDDVMTGMTYESSPIWRYGNIELHFNEDVLYMIYTNYVDTMSAGKKIKLDRWILADQKQTTLEYWISELNQNTKNYRVVHKPELEQTIIALEKETDSLVLTFQNDDWRNSGITPSHYPLQAIQLWSTEYRDS